MTETTTKTIHMTAEEVKGVILTSCGCEGLDLRHATSRLGDVTCKRCLKVLRDRTVEERRAS